jgi:hypothetical protein
MKASPKRQKTGKLSGATAEGTGNCQEKKRKEERSRRGATQRPGQPPQSDIKPPRTHLHAACTSHAQREAIDDEGK